MAGQEKLYYLIATWHQGTCQNRTGNGVMVHCRLNKTSPGRLHSRPVGSVLLFEVFKVFFEQLALLV